MSKYENPWFLLYDGDSPDGRGAPDYVGRTYDAKVAYKHYKELSQNPYSTGCVMLITDKHYVRIWSTADVEWLRQEAGDECPGHGKCDDQGCPAHYATGE